MYQFEEEIVETDNSKIPKFYSKGFLLTRKGVGVMQKVRSLRVDLSQFSLTSENRRVLRKNEDVSFSIYNLPLDDYNWKIHKMGADFYRQRFGDKVMSANKIKDMVKEKKTSFNKLMVFSKKSQDLGYAICFEYGEILHYAYPFYDLSYTSKTLGIFMMTRAIIYAQDESLKYVYLGSVNSKEALYKLQFRGLSFFEKDSWKSDLEDLKRMLRD
jgi:arginyl-tRNA--protein-N-Asp/Glu arginylyltransferase